MRGMTLVLSGVGRCAWSGPDGVNGCTVAASTATAALACSWPGGGGGVTFPTGADGAAITYNITV